MSRLELAGFSPVRHGLAFSKLLLLIGCFFFVTASHAVAQFQQRKEADAVLHGNRPSPQPDEVSKQMDALLEKNKQELDALLEKNKQRQKHQSEEFSKSMDKRMDELSRSINERLDKKRSQRTHPLVGIALILLIFAWCIGIILLCNRLHARLLHAVRNQLLRIDNPVGAKRWRTFWLVGLQIILAPFVYAVAAQSHWFRERGLLFFAPAEWIFMRVHGPDGNLTIPGLFVVLGFFTFSVMLSLFALRASRFCRQRRDDLVAEALFVKIATGADAVEPFVLYLRPFASTDAFKIRVRYGQGVATYELEEVLSKAVRPFGLLIALGGSVEHVGAARIKSTDVNWQEAVTRLMRQALLIVMVPSARPGTLWEIQQLLAENWIVKTAFIDAPNTSTVSFAQDIEWSKISQLLSSHGYKWPADDPKGRLIFFGGSKSPQLSEPLDFEGPILLRAALKRVVTLAGGSSGSRKLK